MPNEQKDCAVATDYQSPQVRIVRTKILGEPILFAIDQPKDVIQSHHLAGRFYEPDELMIMSKAFPVGGRLLDIGANVGNHTIFFGRCMNASDILPVEVNPRVLGLLRTNIILNGLEAICDLDHLGVGFYDETIDDAGIAFRERNIGGGRLKLGDGKLHLTAGDNIVDRPFDLVKIDVEGAELKVLAGLKRFISYHRPCFFIEVDIDNTDAFAAWMTENQYQELEQFQRYRRSINYLIAPIEAS